MCTAEEPIYILTELMKHGSLLSHLRHDGQSLGVSALIDMSAEVASGMAYLEKTITFTAILQQGVSLLGREMDAKLVVLRWLS